MKLIIIMVLLMTTLPLSADTDSVSVSTFKQVDKIKVLLGKYTEPQYSISFSEAPMGGSCGYVGCQWQHLISMVITSKGPNAPSLTFLAVVSGQTPDRGVKPTVRFVELTDMDPGKWAAEL